MLPDRERLPRQGRSRPDNQSPELAARRRDHRTSQRQTEDLGDQRDDQTGVVIEGSTALRWRCEHDRQRNEKRHERGGISCCEGRTERSMRGRPGQDESINVIG